MHHTYSALEQDSRFSSVSVYTGKDKLCEHFRDSYSYTVCVDFRRDIISRNHENAGSFRGLYFHERRLTCEVCENLYIHRESSMYTVTVGK